MAWGYVNPSYSSWQIFKGSRKQSLNGAAFCIPWKAGGSRKQGWNQLLRGGERWPKSTRPASIRISCVASFKGAVQESPVELSPWIEVSMPDLFWLTCAHLFKEAVQGSQMMLSSWGEAYLLAQLQALFGWGKATASKKEVVKCLLGVFQPLLSAGWGEPFKPLLSAPQYFHREKKAEVQTLNDIWTHKYWFGFRTSILVCVGS